MCLGKGIRERVGDCENAVLSQVWCLILSDVQRRLESGEQRLQEEVWQWSWSVRRKALNWMHCGTTEGSVGQAPMTWSPFYWLSFLELF